MSEADIFNIVMLYADQEANRFEFFMAGTFAMVVALFVVGDKLTTVMRWLTISIYSAFVYSQFMFSLGARGRIADAVYDLGQLDKDQVVKSSVIEGMIQAPLNPSIVAGLNMDNLLMLFGWIITSMLMIYPKLIINIKK